VRGLLSRCEAWRAAGIVHDYSPVLTVLGHDLTDSFALLRGDAGLLRALLAGDELCAWGEEHRLSATMW